LSTIPQDQDALLAGSLPVFRHFHLVGQVAEFVRVGTDHQADDLIGALLVQAVLVVEGKPDPLFLIARVVEEPALRRLDQHVVRNLASHLEQGDDGVGIGRVLFPAEHRQTHFLDVHVAHFVEQREQHVAGHELDQVLALRWREILEPRVLVDLASGRFHPGLELLRSGLEPFLELCRGGRGSRLRSGRARARQDAGQDADVQQPVRHCRLPVWFAFAGNVRVATQRQRAMRVSGTMHRRRRDPARAHGQSTGERG
jgi:hypothetical protein